METETIIKLALFALLAIIIIAVVVKILT